MNLQASLFPGDEGVIASLGAGRVIVNDYVIELSSIENGHRLSVSRGSEESHIDIPNGEKGDTGVGIAGALFGRDDTLTLLFSDGTSYTTPSLRGEKGSSDWNELTNKPTAFPPESHGHEMSEVNGLNAALLRLDSAMRETGMDGAAYHLGFYRDVDGDLCENDD